MGVRTEVTQAVTTAPFEAYFCSESRPWSPANSIMPMKPIFIGEDRSSPGFNPVRFLRVSGELRGVPVLRQTWLPQG